MKLKDLIWGALACLFLKIASAQTMPRPEMLNHYGDSRWSCKSQDGRFEGQAKNRIEAIKAMTMDCQDRTNASFSKCLNYLSAPSKSTCLSDEDHSNS